jgi:hypothetical protein
LAENYIVDEANNDQGENPKNKDGDHNFAACEALARHLGKGPLIRRDFNRI